MQNQLAIWYARIWKQHPNENNKKTSCSKIARAAKSSGYCIARSQLSVVLSRNSVHRQMQKTFCCMLSKPYTIEIS